MTEKLSVTCIGCPAYITSTKYANIDFCKYSVGSVPRINCELGGILKHEKALETEVEGLRIHMKQTNEDYQFVQKKREDAEAENHSLKETIEHMLHGPIPIIDKSSVFDGVDSSVSKADLDACIPPINEENAKMIGELLIEEINQRIKNLKDKLAKAQELAEGWIMEKPDKFISDSGRWLYRVECGRDLKKALGGDE